ncbi:retrovirus-related Pol polyprotein [Pseudoscourfieldia marina]
MHQDPAPNLQSLERILTEFFPGTPDNMKIALLMRTVNTDKYRSILDSMKIPGMVIPTYLELKQAVQNHYATDRAEHEQKMKGGKRKAQQEENRTPKPKISPHAALATAVAAEVQKTLTKNATALATNEGLPQLKRPQLCNNCGQITIEHTTSTCPNPRPGGGRGRGGRGAAGGRGRGYGRGYTQYGQIDIKDVECFKSRGQRRDVSLSRLELYDNRGNTYPIKIVDNFFCVEVAPPLDFDMTIDTTFHQSPAAAYAIHALEGLRLLHLRLAHFNETKIKASIAAGAKFGEHKTSADTATKKLTHLCRGCVEGKAHDIPKHRQSERTDRVGGALVHTDIKTDVPTPSYRGDKYFIHFTDDKTRHTVPYALRKKSDSANALLQYVAFMRSKGIEIKELRADSEKVLNEGEMKKTALANNIHTSTTPPYDKKAGGRHERIIDTLWTHVMAILFAAPHVPRKYWPIVLKTVAIIYNNMTHGATDKIPSIELFRSADDLSALRIIGSLIYVYIPKQLRNAMQPHGKQYIYLGFKDAHSAYVYDPVTDTVYIRGHRLLSVELATSSDNTISGVDSHTVSGTAAPVEGGGGDGLDEVDKFIHDALNQAPPTEGGASPIEGGGEPDLGALGIHGHSEQMVNDRVYKRITRITGDHTYEAYNRTDGANQRLARGSNPDTPFAESIDRLNNYDSIFANPPFPSVTELQLHIRDCEAVFDANKTLSITLVIPDWESVTVDRWEYLFSIPAGEEVYRHPNGKSCGKTRWDVAVYRLCRSSHDGLTPAVIRRNTRLEDIRVKDVFLWQEGDFINSVAEIHTANKGTTFVYLIGLLEYHPEVWDQVLQHAKPEQNMFRKVELHAWPGWDGLIVGYDTNTQVYEIAFSNGEFDDAKKNEFDVKGSAALMTAQTADTNPILTSENRKNIFVPTNSRELMAMKPGPLKSLYLEAMGTEISNMERNGVYRWVYLPAGQHTIRGRVIFEIKFDPITGLLLKAKARLVAQGFTQIFGVDFFETYASTPKVSTMRMFMFIVVTYEMKMDEFDVRAAYLHSYLTETIYMKPPHGLERYDENGNELIWLLVKSLYGLRQSGHNWMVDFFSFWKGMACLSHPPTPVSGSFTRMEFPSLHCLCIRTMERSPTPIT